MTGDSVVVVGGGHNGLVAAILAAQAGRRVTVLERSSHLGGASIGSAVFPGRDVRLSRYSYLVSLFPDTWPGGSASTCGWHPGACRPTPR